MIISTVDSLGNLKWVYNSRNLTLTERKHQAEFFPTVEACNSFIDRVKKLGYKFSFTIEGQL